MFWGWTGDYGATDIGGVKMNSSPPVEQEEIDQNTAYVKIKRRTVRRSLKQEISEIRKSPIPLAPNLRNLMR
jgi:hypothetical protein